MCMMSLFLGVAGHLWKRHRKISYSTNNLLGELAAGVTAIYPIKRGIDSIAVGISKEDDDVLKIKSKTRLAIYRRVSCNYDPTFYSISPNPRHKL